jgi:hypothetical protein
VGDFFCGRDVLGQAQEDHHDSFAEHAPGVIHYRLEGESAQHGDEDGDEAEAEHALVDPFASLMGTLPRSRPSETCVSLTARL